MSTKMSTKMRLMDYVNAGYPAVIYNTPEEDRALAECRSVARTNNLDFAVWSVSKGFQKDQKVEAITVPKEALKKGLEVNSRGNGGIYCLLDFHPFFLKNPENWRVAKDVFKDAKSKGITFVFISVKFEVIPELEREVIVASLELPGRDEIRKRLEDLAGDFNCKVSKKDKEDAVEAALGLTLNEAENAFAVSLAKEHKFNPKIISEVKKQIICNGGLLEYKSSDETLESIGGLKNFTTWAAKRLSAYSTEAQKYGLPYPRGVLLIGIPGCGKSLTAKALANMWQKPLLKLDVGKLFGSLVGDTEANTRRALEMAEAMAPAILWIDEIEKGLSGVQASGKTDSGVTSRMFGTILTWLQEKKAPVFVIATANNISQLPPEFLRKGRFDEIFFVDLPDFEERKAIFEIQLKKYKRNPEKFDIPSLAEKATNYTGAEIEECIVSAMFNAWNDGQREPTTDDIIISIGDIAPMADGVMKPQVEHLREYAQNTALKRANGNTITKPEQAKSGRVIRTSTEGGNK